MILLRFLLLFVFWRKIGRTHALVSSRQEQQQYPKIPILWETDQLLVVNKPAGLNHHDTSERVIRQQQQQQNIHNNDVDDDDLDTSQYTQPGVMTLLRQQINDDSSQSATQQPQRLYGVHRLDQVTSGILIIGKTPTAARCLTRAFTERKVVKYYVGMSLKKPPSRHKQGWVRGYMQRGRRKSWYLSKERRKPSDHTDDTTNINTTTPTWAETYFWTSGLGNLHYEGPDGTPAPRTLLLFRPTTGRTHQLRVAAKSVGLPLVGDPLYTTTTTTSSSSTTATTGTTASNHKVLFPRTCLHATGLYIARQHVPELNLKEDLILWSVPPFCCNWWKEQSQPDITKLLRKDVNVPTGLLRQATLQNEGSP
jgi:23S rRNA-/tRNA-specific pseudouridylate synthase